MSDMSVCCLSNSVITCKFPSQKVKVVFKKTPSWFVYRSLEAIHLSVASPV